MDGCGVWILGVVVLFSSIFPFFRTPNSQQTNQRKRRRGGRRLIDACLFRERGESDVVVLACVSIRFNKWHDLEMISCASSSDSPITTWKSFSCWMIRSSIPFFSR